MEKKNVILVKNLTQDELVEVMQNALLFDKDSEVTLCSTVDPLIHILYLPEDLSVYQFDEMFLYLITEDGTEKAEFTGWVTVDDSVYGINPGDFLAVKNVNDEGSMIPIYVNRCNTCYIEKHLDEDHDNDMSREEEKFYKDRDFDAISLVQSTKIKTTFVPCKLPEVTNTEVIPFSAYVIDESKLDTANFAYTAWGYLGIIGKAQEFYKHNRVIATPIFAVAFFLLLILAATIWSLFHFAMIPFFPKVIIVLLLAVSATFIIAKKINKKRLVPLKIKDLMAMNLFEGLVIAMVLIGIILGVNRLLSSEVKTEEVKIVKNKQTKDHYEVEFALPFYPYNYEAGKGKDSTFTVGSTAILHYREGLLGIKIYDALTHE